MKRMRLMMMTLFAVLAVSGVVTSSAAANFCGISVGNKGNFNRRTPDNPTGPCELPVGLGTGKYIIVVPQGVVISPTELCIETGEANMGNYNNAQCTGAEVPNSRWTKIYSAGARWRTEGVSLKQGTKQLKLQLKGKAVLTAKPAVGEPFVIECKNSISEGAAIEGNGVGAGQDKGRLTFTQCATSIETCKVAEPITTNQTKSYLAYSKQAQSKIIDIFEPQQGSKYVEVKLSGKCGALSIGANPVSGKVAAEVIPANSEGQEGMLNWPATPIKEAIHEGEEVKGLELKLATLSSTFVATYGARLATGERYGAFEE